MLQALRPYFLLRFIFFGLLFALVLIYLIVGDQKEAIIKENTLIGKAISESLVAHGEYGVITANREILKNLITGLTTNKDVLYATIVDTLSPQNTLADYNSSAYNLDPVSRIPEKTSVRVRTLPDKTVYLDIVSPFYLASENIVEEESLYIGSGQTHEQSGSGKVSGFFRMGLSIKAKLDEFKYNTAKVCAVVALSIFFFSLYYYYLLTKVVVRPLNKFIGKTRNIKSGRLIFNTEGIQASNEIGELGKTFEKTVQDLKSAAEALKSSEERLKLITSSAKDGIIMINMRGEILFTNPAVKNIFELKDGVKFENAICSYIDICKGECSLSVKGVNCPKDYSELQRILKKRVGSTGEFTGRKSGGEKFYLELSLSPVVRGDEELMVGVIRDITERKLAESELRLLSSALKQTEDMVIVTNLAWEIEYVNPSLMKITGYSRDEVMGNDPQFLNCTEDGSGVYDEIKKTVALGSVWRGRLVSERKDGSAFEEDVSVFPLLDDCKIPIKYIFVKQDVTARVQMERAILQNHKMEAIGKLASGIAHDFNNILTGISGFAKLTMGLVPKKSREEYFLQCVLDGAKRASDLIKLILNFGSGRKSVVVVDLEKIVLESLMLLRPSLLPSIKIETDLKSGCTVLAAESEMHQVVMNVLTNSCDAMARKGGVLKISTDIVVIGKREEGVNEKLTTGKYARLTIQDSGEGISKGVMDRLFEPFYTTKKEGKGTGFGLFTAHRIVDSMNGRITIDSTVGEGTTFSLYFSQAGKFVKKSPSPETARGGSERILIVEDEEPVILILQSILETHGYTVVVAKGSEEALRIFDEGRDDFDLVITDLMLPYMRGDCLAEKIVSLKPDLPVIICTGFCDKDEKEKAFDRGVKAFVMKPFVDDSLLFTVRNILDRADSC